MSSVRVIWLGDGDQPTAWVLLDRAGSVLEEGACEPGEALAPGLDANIVIAPGEDVRLLRLEAPGPAAQAGAAALWVQRETLAQSPEETCVAVGPLGDDGRRWVAFVSASRAAAWRERLAGLDAVVVPDSLIPPAPDADGDLNAVLLGDRIAFRGRDEAFTLEAELADWVSAGRSVWMAPPERCMPLIADLAHEPPINLLARPASHRRGRVVVWPLALACVLMIPLAPLALGCRDQILTRRIGAEDARLARETLRTDPLPSSEAALRAELSRSLPLGGWTDATSAVFEAVEATPGARLQRLVLTQGRLSLAVRHPSAADLETMVSALKTRGFGVEVRGSVDQPDEGIETTLEMVRP